MASFPREVWVGQHQKGKTILDFNEVDGVASAGNYV